MGQVYNMRQVEVASSCSACFMHMKVKLLGILQYLKITEL